MTDLYLVATITSGLAITICIFALFLMQKDSRKLFIILSLIMLPMNGIAFHFLRMPIDTLLSHFIDNHKIIQFIRIFYAPFTEEPAKLWILFLPWFFQRISTTNLFIPALAIGFGFGIGEVWTVATLLSKNPELVKYPWFMLGGFLSERLMVCFFHAAFTGTAMFFIIKKKLVFLALFLCMTLHFAGNSPIFLSHLNVFGIGQIAWAHIQQIFMIVYFLGMIAILLFLFYGRNWLWKTFKGQTLCPECKTMYDRPIFKINLLHKSFERCTNCKHWHFVNSIDTIKPIQQ